MSTSHAVKLKRMRTRELRLTIKLMRLVTVLVKAGKLPVSENSCLEREAALLQYEKELAFRDARDELQGNRLAHHTGHAA